jgi:oligopeptide transport system ATP-binding protein
VSQNHNLEPILDIRNLSTSFYTTQGEVKAVDQVSLSLMKGQTLGLVGESGCGKSVTSLSILRLIEGAQGRIKSGEVFFSGRDLVK